MRVSNEKTQSHARSTRLSRAECRREGSVRGVIFSNHLGPFPRPSLFVFHRIHSLLDDEKRRRGTSLPAASPNNSRLLLSDSLSLSLSLSFLAHSREFPTQSGITYFPNDPFSPFAIQRVGEERKEREETEEKGRSSPRSIEGIDKREREIRTRESKF